MTVIEVVRFSYWVLFKIFRLLKMCSYKKCYTNENLRQFQANYFLKNNLAKFKTTRKSLVFFPPLQKNIEW